MSTADNQYEVEKKKKFFNGIKNCLSSCATYNVEFE